MQRTHTKKSLTRNDNNALSNLIMNSSHLKWFTVALKQWLHSCGDALTMNRLLPRRTKVTHPTCALSLPPILSVLLRGWIADGGGSSPRVSRWEEHDVITDLTDSRMRASTKETRASRGLRRVGLILLSTWHLLYGGNWDLCPSW